MTVQLYPGDCLEILPTLEAGSVDLITADYPFAFSDNGWDSTPNQAADLIEGTMPYVANILKPNGSAFLMFGPSTVAAGVVMAGRCNLDLVNWIVWRFDLGYHPTSRFKSRAYHIPWFAKGNWTFNGDAVRVPHRTTDKRNNPAGAIPSDVWTDIPELRKNSAEYLGHRGQKPEALLRRIIKAASNPGEVVLDFVMGSGTTGVACVQTGRNFIGIEIDPGYFAIAEKRIKEAEAQMRMPL